MSGKGGFGYSARIDISEIHRIYSQLGGDIRTCSDTNKLYEIRLGRRLGESLMVLKTLPFHTKEV